MEVVSSRVIESTRAPPVSMHADYLTNKLDISSFAEEMEKTAPYN